ncbi:hypothetical protein PLEOSDRAFT_1101341 [Pleurotus ostreatus PC15]|uniref:Peptide N-acetyl-beta-D-glucosaminyl asparaginase amidase A N-terminal domain-containing protein n=2 Tax=Pleurotus TaxID=5320 RepID=A0A067P3C5_PLEO1|nr:hypothetical protein CCMSSC00406_0000082 [Pleurotus cornucopiae]KDQ30346.1 hypothetical protein PLEOSDRAFT_1101341 [Pleurotus ostreatus PC15]
MIVMKAGILALIWAAFLLVDGQPSPEELAPLLDGLFDRPTQEASGTAADLQKRVPLMTDDPTVAPLIDLQVFAPPVVPKGGTSCTVKLLEHSFGVDSFNKPAIVSYLPPVSPQCGKVGEWAAISLNLSVFSIGTQYDRLGAIYLSHTEIWRTSSAEPTKTGTIWTTIKDMTKYTPLFAKPGDLMMDFSNIVDTSLLLDAAFDVTITATFYAPTKAFPTPDTPDLIISLSNLSPTLPNFFTVDNDAGATTVTDIPDTTEEAYVEIICSGNSAEEFWYLNTPDEFIDTFPPDAGLIGKGPFREVQVLVDGQLAGVVWPHAVIYTGGITPSNWRPLTSFGAYDQPTYWISITPFIPQLLTANRSHTITLRVQGQGSNPSINSNWFVSGSVHIRKGKGKITGKLTKHEVGPLEIKTTGGATAGNKTLHTRVTAKRKLVVEAELKTSHGRQTVTFTQDLEYTNEADYEDEGWIQRGAQSTIGTTEARHGVRLVLRDAFSYPLAVFSNYSLFTQELGGYGSDIHQNHTRALQPPFGFQRSIHSVQHAKGQIGMDDWPGLRHAINGTGETTQLFAYSDGRGETYFRDVAAMNDGWVKDEVWGTLKDANPPVPRSQIFGPGGGPGFRRMVARGRR